MLVFLFSIFIFCLILSATGPVCVFNVTSISQSTFFFYLVFKHDFLFLLRNFSLTLRKNNASLILVIIFEVLD